MAVAPSRRPPLSFGRDAGSLSLEELLGEARESFVDELAIPMTVDQPPSLYDVNAAGEREYQATQGAQVGLSMSPQLYRFLGHPSDDYGNVFPVSRALDDLRGWCRGRHLEARSGPWLDHAADAAASALWRRMTVARPLCARLAFYTVTMRVPLSRLAAHEGLSVNRARELLYQALRHAWEQRREWAHVDESGVAEVLAAQRRERREARARAEASRLTDVTCRFCGRPYDPTSQEPCPGSADAPSDAAEAVMYAEAGFTLLCSPADLR